MKEMPVQKRKIILSILTLLLLSLALGFFKRSIRTNSESFFDLDAQIAKSRSMHSNLQGSSEMLSVSINAADVDSLCLLPGIGKIKAARIIEYRQTNGGFKTKEELINVKGIGPKIFANLKDCVVLK